MFSKEYWLEKQHEQVSWPDSIHKDSHWIVFDYLLFKYDHLTNSFETDAYKTHALVKEITEETNKWKNIHVHGLKGLILLKCPYYRFNAIPTETPKTCSFFFFFAKIALTILKIHLEPWRYPINGKDAKNKQWS